MDVFATKDVRNSTTLLIIIGMLLVLVINSIDSLIPRLLSILFSVTPIRLLTLLSISFHGLIAMTLIGLLFRIVASQKFGRTNPTVFLAHTSFKTFGLIFVIIIVSSVILKLYVKSNMDEPVDLSKISYADTGDILYLGLVQTGVILLRDLILIVMYFVIIFKSK